MEEIERFTAEGDDGRRYTVVLWAAMVESRPLKGGVERRPGSTVFQLLDGRHVNQKDATTFEIFDTEEVIRKVID